MEGGERKNLKLVVLYLTTKSRFVGNIIIHIHAHDFYFCPFTSTGLS